VQRLLNATPGLIQALERHSKLSPAAHIELENLGGQTESYQSGDYIEGPRGPGRPLLVLDGWVAEQHTLADGRRQVLRIALAGEISGLGDKLPDLRTETVALTDVTVADLTPLRRAVREGRGEASLLAVWRKLELLQHASDLRQVVRLGSLSAVERTGHLLLELYERSAFAGLTHGAVMSLPLTQTQIADYLGLSAEHANRVIQQLRRDGLIEAHSRVVVFRRLEELATRSCYQLGRYPAPRADGPALAFAQKSALQ
jgi:CRP-like cAMP-binding protein